MPSKPIEGCLVCKCIQLPQVQWIEPQRCLCGEDIGCGLIKLYYFCNPVILYIDHFVLNIILDSFTEHKPHMSSLVGTAFIVSVPWSTICCLTIWTTPIHCESACRSVIYNSCHNSRRSHNPGWCAFQLLKNDPSCNAGNYVRTMLLCLNAFRTPTASSWSHRCHLTPGIYTLCVKFPTGTGYWKCQFSHSNTGRSTKITSINLNMYQWLDELLQFGYMYKKTMQTWYLV